MPSPALTLSPGSIGSQPTTLVQAGIIFFVDGIRQSGSHQTEVESLPAIGQDSERRKRP